ncbi:hypothetical protein [Tessaracoccus sp. Z1128]
MTTATQQRPGGGTEALNKSFAGDTPSLRDNGAVRLAPADAGTVAQARLAALSAQLGSMARRLIEDALLGEMPAVWERRALQIEAGHPMIGNTLLEQIPDRAEAAAACRERAELLRRYPEIGILELGGVVSDALAEQGVNPGE